MEEVYVPSMEMQEEEQSRNIGIFIRGKFEENIRANGSLPEKLALDNLLHLRMNDPKFNECLEYDCPRDMHIVNFYVQIMRGNPALFGMENHLTKSTSPVPSHTKFEKALSKLALQRFDVPIRLEHPPEQ